VIPYVQAEKLKGNRATFERSDPPAARGVRTLRTGNVNEGAKTMQQACDRVRPAFNDNLPTTLSEAVASSMCSLTMYAVPEAQRQRPAGVAFRYFRQLLVREFLSDGTDGEAGTYRTPRWPMVAEAARVLADAPCFTPLDLSAKALAFNTLVYHCAAFAASRRDPAALVRDAELLASFAAGLASDFLARDDGLAAELGEA